VQLPLGRPAIRALSGFTFARPMALHASTMLNAAFVGGHGTSAGIVFTKGLVTKVRKPS